jgi:hypothetical protein
MKRGDDMLKVRNRLRILGSLEDIVEVKSLLENHQDKQNKPLDFHKIDPNFKGILEDVTVGYDHYEFTSNESVLPQIKELSKRFGDVRFAIQSWSEKTSEKDHMTIIEIEKSHMVLHAGEIISESKQTSYESSFRNDVKSIEEPKTQKEKQDLSVQKNTMFELQERFFKDIQDFMKDFTSTFFKRWY